MNSIHKEKNMTVLILCCAVMTACGSKDIPAVNTNVSISSETLQAEFLGVENYGSEDVNIENADDFKYRFMVGGQEVTYKIDNGEDHTYPIQNKLKEGYTFTIEVQDGVISSAEEIVTDTAAFEPVISGVPGKKTLKNFISTAFMPVGTTLYVFGGGWDWQDTGSSIQSRTIGVSEDWVRFFNEQDENYTFRDKDDDDAKKDPPNSYYPYGGYNEYYYAGLDCSGYVAWTVYNILNTESGGEGYVTKSTNMAKSIADMGYGEKTADFEKPVNGSDPDFRPGDIFSTSGHVWISLGTCADGSILILHSTPAPSRTGQPGGGVELSAIGDSEECNAYKLADKYMSEYYPEWYARYPIILKDYDKLTKTTDENAGKFSWVVTGENGGLTDPEGYRNMTPEEVLEDLFKDAGLSE